MALMPGGECANGGMAMGYDPDFEDWSDKRPGALRANDEATPPVALWSWVYSANLPLPALMGAILSFGPGLFGMAAGVVILHEAGRRACYRYPRTLRTVSCGGVVVAVAQLFPVVHVLAGMAGVGATCLIVQQDYTDGSKLDPAAALIATVFTGLILIAWAGAMGLIGRAVCYIASRLSPGVQGEWDGTCKP